MSCCLAAVATAHAALPASEAAFNDITELRTAANGDEWCDGFPLDPNHFDFEEMDVPWEIPEPGELLEAPVAPDVPAEYPETADGAVLARPEAAGATDDVFTPSPGNLKTADSGLPLKKVKSKKAPNSVLSCVGGRTTCAGGGKGVDTQCSLQ